MSREHFDLRVQLSIYERIINALARVKHNRSDDCVTRDMTDVAALKAVIEPELVAARREAFEAGAKAMREAIADHWLAAELRALDDLDAIDALPKNEGHGERYIDVARGQARARADHTRVFPLPETP